MRKQLKDIQKIYLQFRYLIEKPIALILFVLFIPLFTAICVLISIDSKGPIYVPNHFRLGKGKRVFKMFKFRTMSSGYEKVQPSKVYRSNMYKEENDPRVTRFGRWLRKTDIDELPQLINVLTGKMTFFGPRAFMPEEAKYYSKIRPDLRDLINYRTIVKPGLTGLWQISGRNKTGLVKRLRLDAQEIQNTGPLQDIKILIRTIRNLITQKWQ